MTRTLILARQALSNLLWNHPTRGTLAIILLIAITSLAICPFGVAQNHRHIVLPDFKLAGSSAPDISQIWQHPKPDDPRAIYPKQISIDIDNNVVQGLTAIYDKSISIGDLQLAINEHYGNFVLENLRVPPMQVWRVEPEKFVISLSEAEDGMKQVIYLKFSPVSVRPGWQCKFSE